MAEGLDLDVNLIVEKVVSGLYPNVKTSELDVLAAETGFYMSVHNQAYATFAARISVSDLHKNTNPQFSKVMTMLYEHMNLETHTWAPILSDSFMASVRKHAAKLDASIKHERDYAFNYFGFQTLTKGSYLMKINGETVERPQHALMRVAIGIHGDNIDAILEVCFFLLSKLTMQTVV